MNLVEAFILGAIQGITEWLPISSSGHLVLAQSVMDLTTQENLVFDLIVHLGTLLAVCVYFSKELGRIIVSMLTSKDKRDAQMNTLRTLGFLLLVATIPAAVIGVLISSVIEDVFGVRNVGIALVVNGFLLFAFSRFGSSGTRRRFPKLTERSPEEAHRVRPFTGGRPTRSICTWRRYPPGFWPMRWGMP